MKRRNASTLKENGQEVLSNFMAQPHFRVVEKEKLHARDIARREVKRWREEELPICNQFHSGAAHLDVDEIVKRTERTMPEDEYRKPFPWASLVLIAAFLIGMIWILVFGG